MVDKLLEVNYSGVLKYYNKSEDDIKSDIRSLVEWFKKQPHLPMSEEHKLRIWLMNNKFNLERTKHRLEVHYAIRNSVPEFFANWDVFSPEIQRALNTIMWVTLPILTPDLNRITVFKLIDSNPNIYDPWETCKIAFLVCELRATADCNVGEHLIYDLQGFSIEHVFKLSITYLKKLYVTAMDAYSARICGVHLLNTLPGTDILLSMLKLIMKPKIFERMHVHKNLESLYDFVPREILPNDLGGNEPPCEEVWDIHPSAVYQKSISSNSYIISAKWKEEMGHMRSFLINEVKKKSDESQRTNEINDNLFGSVSGSFRQLQVD